MNNEEPWEFYDVEWSEDEIKELEEELKYKARLFREALEKKDPSILPRVHENMRWKCRSCKYREKCEKLKA